MDILEELGYEGVMWNPDDFEIPEITPEIIEYNKHADRGISSGGNFNEYDSIILDCNGNPYDLVECFKNLKRPGN